MERREFILAILVGPQFVKGVSVSNPSPLHHHWTASCHFTHKYDHARIIPTISHDIYLETGFSDEQVERMKVGIGSFVCDNYFELQPHHCIVLDSVDKHHVRLTEYESRKTANKLGQWKGGVFDLNVLLAYSKSINQ